MNTLLRSVAKRASVLVLALAASMGAMLPSTAFAEGERFVMISHAPDSDSWWNTIKTAINQAGEQLDVKWNTVTHHQVT